MNIDSIIKSIKKNLKTKRCYHPQAGNSCRKYINAHSIQENKELDSIAKDGNVFQIKPEISKDRTTYKVKSQGKGIASAFYGFCEPHDNELFGPIDTQILVPTSEQAFLLAYRSLCKELFSKENAINILVDSIEQVQDKYKREMLDGLLIGNWNGLNNLYIHKESFDNKYLSQDFNDIRYYILFFDSHPIMHFSGLTYPDYDFHSNQLQNILTNPSLLTFSSVLTQKGWSIVFSWLDESDDVCTAFIDSLEKRLFSGDNLTDLLFNFIIKSCENIAFSPDWWNSLSKNSQNKIIDLIQVRDSNFIMASTDRYDHVEISIQDWEYVDTKTNIRKTKC